MIVVANQGGSGGSGNRVLTLASAVTHGSLLVAAVAERDSTTGGSISDTKGNVWTKIAYAPHIPTLYLFYCVGCRAMTTSDTITFTAVTANSTTIGVLSATGIDPFWPYDPAIFNTDSENGTGANPSVTSALPTTTSTLVVGFAAGQTSQTGTQASGWTNGPNAANGTGANLLASIGGHKVLTNVRTISTYDPTTINESNNNADGLIVGFMASKPTIIPILRSLI